MVGFIAHYLQKFLPAAVLLPEVLLQISLFNLLNHFPFYAKLTQVLNFSLNMLSWVNL
jgi:hypothetical protein